jgi:hypothetical protein
LTASFAENTLSGVKKNQRVETSVRLQLGNFEQG